MQVVSSDTIVNLYSPSCYSLSARQGTVQHLNSFALRSTSSAPSVWSTSTPTPLNTPHVPVGKGRHRLLTARCRFTAKDCRQSAQCTTQNKYNIVGNLGNLWNGLQYWSTTNLKCTLEAKIQGLETRHTGCWQSSNVGFIPSPPTGARTNYLKLVVILVRSARVIVRVSRGEAGAEFSIEVKSLLPRPPVVPARARLRSCLALGSNHAGIIVEHRLFVHR